MATRVIVGFVLLLVFAVPLSAQDETFPVYCGNLPEADCTLLQDAYANLFNLHSGSVELRMWAVNGSTKDEVFSGVLSGAFTDFDATALLPTLSLKVFRTLKLDARTTTSMREAPQATLPDAQMIVQPDIPFRTETPTQIIDGTLYVDLDTLQAVVGAEYNGWGLTAGYFF
ncbi:MAG: hypothetical protein H6672_20205 [Anaerolineaceae bacterium]|nr:hypothetical protein [Anaerolineaceae bacterium]